MPAGPCPRNTGACLRRSRRRAAVALLQLVGTFIPALHALSRLLPGANSLRLPLKTSGLVHRDERGRARRRARRHAQAGCRHERVCRGKRPAPHPASASASRSGVEVALGSARRGKHTADTADDARGSEAPARASHPFKMRRWTRGLYTSTLGSKYRERFPSAVPQWYKDGSTRTGVLALKVGMTALWDQWGRHMPISVLHVDNCEVVQVKRHATDGHTALQLGAGEAKPKNVRPTLRGHFAKAGIA